MLKNNNPLKKHVHFIGIGGIGVSALARYFLSQGYKVSGSDACFSEIISELRKDGAKVYVGHDSSNLSDSASLTIYSSAIPKNNPELLKARKLGIPIKLYSEALGDLTSQYKTLAVAGAHGKSTTTAMLSLVLKKTKFNPTVIIGTKLKEFGNRNFQKGKGDYLVLEADEYHRSFLNYSPFSALITNIDREHLDYYKNLAEIKNVFLKFIGNIQPNGILVVNKDDKNLFNLRNKIQKIAEKNNLKVYWYGITLDRRSQTQCNKLKKVLKIPGEHNISNALAVYTLAKALGIKNNVILNALNKYHGAWRRMEYKGKLKIENLKLKIDIYDDYAHHPTEIKATLAAFRQKYPDSRIICVFQPHQFQRLKYLFKEFTSCFDDTDNLILLDVYKVKGRDQNIDKYKRITSEKLAEVIKNKKQSPAVLYLKNSKNLKKEIKKIVNQFSPRQSVSSPRKSAIVVMMGAGDIYKMTDKLVK